MIRRYAMAMRCISPDHRTDAWHRQTRAEQEKVTKGRAREKSLVSVSGGPDPRLQ